MLVSALAVPLTGLPGAARITHFSNTKIPISLTKPASLQNAPRPCIGHLESARGRSPIAVAHAFDSGRLGPMATGIGSRFPRIANCGKTIMIPDDNGRGRRALRSRKWRTRQCDVTKQDIRIRGERRFLFSQHNGKGAEAHHLISLPVILAHIQHGQEKWISRLWRRL